MSAEVPDASRQDEDRGELEDASSSSSTSSDADEPAGAGDGMSVDGQNRDAESGEEKQSSARARSAATALLAGGRSRAKETIVVDTGHKPQAVFVHKLYSMVQTPSLSSLIAWSDNGTVFSVSNPTEFSRTVLPAFFKHSNFQSFVRQLNMYGFHKVNDMLASGPSSSTNPADGVVPWDFQHTSFRRDRPELLVLIKRKSSKALPPPRISRKKSAASATNTSSGHSSRESSEQWERPGSEATNVDGAGSRPRTTGGASSYAGEFSYSGVGRGASAGGRVERGPGGDFGGSSSQGNYAPTPDPFRRMSSASIQNLSASLPYSHQSPHPVTQPRLPHMPHSYPLPSYAQRPNENDEAIGRQLVDLESHVRRLNETLHQNQQEAIAGRAATTSVMQLLLSVVAGMDPTGARKTQIDALQTAIHNLNPSAADSRFPVSVGQSSSQSSYPSISTWSPMPSFQRSPPRQPTQTASPFAQQRVGIATESFARGARGDNDEQTGASALYQSYPSYSSQGYPNPNGRVLSPSVSMAPYVLPQPRPLSSGPQGGGGFAPLARPPWPGAAPVMAGQPAGRAFDTLPPLSSVLGVGEGLRRLSETREIDERFEQGRQKKARH